MGERGAYTSRFAEQAHVNYRIESLNTFWFFALSHLEYGLQGKVVQLYDQRRYLLKPRFHCIIGNRNGAEKGAEAQFDKIKSLLVGSLAGDGIHSLTDIVSG
ncbi:MAG: hypothetical protein E3J21_08465 [Anaerolineales bacterium]|nr:MAG: hypothetical protein E3J21_08465 [Anaerolineales bacterium]